MLDKGNLLAIIEGHRRSSLGYEDGDLSNERATAMDHYHGRPYGNEVDGRSKVVSRDLSETVDWILPQVIKTFLQSGNIAEFLPVGPEDEELAEQESDYVNHVIMKENNGFVALHDVFKDAMLLKNGYWKHYCDESEKIIEEEYAGLSEDELLQLLNTEGVEVKEQEVRMIDMMGTQVPVYDVKLVFTKKEKKIRIEAVPAEEVRVSRSCRGSLQTSLFTEHVTRKTRTELLEMGMDKEFVKNLPSVNSTENDTETYARSSVDDEYNETDGVSYDRSTDLIEYCESYLYVDWDGDDRAELRKIVTVGNQIPDGDEWNEVIEAVPMTCAVVKRVPHRHVGESIDDEIADLQEIKTVLQRQLLDNLYLTNNQEKVVNNRVHLPDMMVSVPGGIKRVMDDMPVEGSVMYLAPPPILNQVLPAIDYIDKVKNNRTGINDTNTGISPDALKETTKGAYLENLRQSSHKIEMMARMLAETGVKELVMQVHGLIMRHIDKPKIVKMRGKYVQINPKEWKERTDLTVVVGIGTGSSEEKRQDLLMLSSLQDKAMQMGMVGPRQGFQMFKDISKTLGRDNPEKYVMDPSGQEFQQFMQMQQQKQQMNPLAEAEKIKGEFKMQAEQMAQQFKGQIEQMKEQNKAQTQMMEQRHQHQMEMLQMQQKSMKEDKDRASKEAIEIMKAEVQVFLEGLKLDMGKPGIGGEFNG